MHAHRDIAKLILWSSFCIHKALLDWKQGLRRMSIQSVLTRGQLYLRSMIQQQVVQAGLSILECVNLQTASSGTSSASSGTASMCHIRDETSIISLALDCTDRLQQGLVRIATTSAWGSTAGQELSFTWHMLAPGPCLQQSLGLGNAAPWSEVHCFFLPVSSCLLTVSKHTCYANILQDSCR